jgi:hypothetical protein
VLTERIHKFLRRIAAEYLEREYGMNLPAHYDDIVTTWANLNQQATRAEWKEFTLALSAQAYGEGFQTGYEFQDPIELGQPERVATAMDPGWEMRQPIDLEQPNAIVVEELPETIWTDDQIKRMARR